MPRRSTTRSRRGAAAPALSDDMYDEIDTFHKEKNELALGMKTSQGTEQRTMVNENEEEDDSSDEEEIMGLKSNDPNHPSYYDSSDSSGSDDDDSDDDDSDYGFNAPPPPRMDDSDHEDILNGEHSALNGKNTKGTKGTKGAKGTKNQNTFTAGWGKKTRNFYGDDDVEEMELESDHIRGQANPSTTLAKMKEREALRLQSKRKSQISEQDYQLDDSDHR